MSKQESSPDFSRMERIHNFRDNGGHQTLNGSFLKKGMIYRSGTLTHASEKDLRAFSSLGIRTVCDLRTHGERRAEPDLIPAGQEVNMVHIPIKVKKHNDSKYLGRLWSLLFGTVAKVDYAEVSKDVYREFVSDFRLQFSNVLQLAADHKNLPMLIHCSAGKDRTGYACALLQLIAGVPLETVMGDYLLTNTYMSAYTDEMMKRLRFFSWIGASRRRLLPLFQARKVYLEAAFEQMTTGFGSPEAFMLQGLELTGQERRRLISLLVETRDRNLIPGPAQ